MRRSKIFLIIGIGMTAIGSGMMLSSYLEVFGHISQPSINMNIIGFSGVIVFLIGMLTLGVRGLSVMKRSHGWTISSIFAWIIFYGVYSTVIEDDKPEYFFLCAIIGVCAIGLGIMAFLNFRKEKKVKSLQQ